jgi:hypothetical protein
LVCRVLATGQTKVTLANLFGVDWEVVDAWVTGVEEPTTTEQVRLRRLLDQASG